MSKQCVRVAVSAGVIAGLVGAACGQGSGGTGPDVIVGDLTGPGFYGTLNGKTAFSLGTTSCNIGTERLNWLDNSNMHPVIAQHIYRIMDGRIEQLGQSYVKHGFASLQGSLCSPCQPGGDFSHLGVGCSDPYGSSLNGSQSGLGRKSDINGATGFFVWPYAQRGQTGDTLFKRIQVDNDDLNPALNPGAVYIGAALYIAADDAAAGNDANNSSYRRLVTSPSGTTWTLGFAGSTQRTKAAIVSWQEHGLGANQPDPGVRILPFTDGDGHLFLGHKVTDLGNGSWRYEYAIENLTSDRGGGAFRVPVPASVTVSDVRFHDVDYHSGEPYDNTDWTSTRTGDAVVWQSPATFAQNPTTNALRWGTLYNFGFTADRGPEEGTVSMEYFKPGAEKGIDLAAQAPAGDSGCNAADVAAEFGVLNANDVIDFVNGFNGGLAVADISPAGGDGLFNANDIIDFVNAFNAGCP